ncbi:MAG: carboxy terminal-processing peptidase [Chitinophagales bacterium]|nr:carboxy terminal-processing peptidase [Chitinophagales bacterium]
MEKPAADNRQLISLIMNGFNAVHYAPQPVNDAFSGKIFYEFIKRIDYNKKIFTQKDIDQLSKYKTSIDDELNDSSYEFFDAVMNLYRNRIDMAYRYSKLSIESPFTFSDDESIETNSDKLSFAPDSNKLKDEWRKYMKLQVLQQLNDKLVSQQKAMEKSDTVKAKSFDLLEEASRAMVKKNNEEFFSRVHELEDNDFMAVYLNCIANIEDPHTEYFPPIQKQNFDIQISGQLEGIGAQLQQRDGEIKITSIVPGSASWRQGQLKANDVILKVGQGNAEPVSVEGMRLDKAIQLIRGKKGTEVRLTVKKPDGNQLTIPIIRDIVVIAATYAQSVIINSASQKIGYIKLPEFYAPVDRKGGRSSSDDVKKELQKLIAADVSGIILDLRDNGGGALVEAVKIGGLFISSGPIVQVRQREGKPNVMSDTDPAVVYSGPLTVMVNENSASASEIVAAALQDYHRAVIIGSDNTYGKGTVQNLFDLDNLVSRQQNSLPELGTLKITIQKFYRINGGATQLKGVVPDIILPDPYAEIPNGEKEDKYAIKWDEVTPARYEPWNATYSLEILKSQSEKRLAANPSFQLIKEEADDFKEQSEHTSYSLNYKKFTQQQAELDLKQKKYDAINADSELLKVMNLDVDLSRVNADSVTAASNTQFIKNLKKDVYLNEATQVVLNMKQE